MLAWNFSLDIASDPTDWEEASRIVWNLFWQRKKSDLLVLKGRRNWPTITWVMTVFGGNHRKWKKFWFVGPTWIFFDLSRRNCVCQALDISKYHIWVIQSKIFQIGSKSQNFFHFRWFPPKTAVTHVMVGRFRLPFSISTIKSLLCVAKISSKQT